MLSVPWWTFFWLSADTGIYTGHNQNFDSSYKCQKTLYILVYYPVSHNMELVWGEFHIMVIPGISAIGRLKSDVYNSVCIYAFKLTILTGDDNYQLLNNTQGKSLIFWSEY